MLGLASGTNMRGLNQFISDIRACKDKESEQKRVQIELAKIRERFTTQKGLNAYQRKKYVWKLLYIHILGYQVDFGYQEASGLINSSKYDEKYTGYVAVSILISEKNQEIWRSISHSIQSDLRSRNQPAQSLALSMIATIVPDSLVNNVADTIIDVALTSKVSLTVRKKAVLCLSRILKKFPAKYDSKKFINPINQMIQRKDCPSSFINAVASLLLTSQQIFNPEHFRDALPKVARLLHKLAINKQCSSQYLYFTIPNPWLQMKLYKILQLWSPPEEKGVLSLIEETLTKVLKRTDASKSINKNNIQYGLLFEAINVIIHYDQKIGAKLIDDLSKILSVFISSSQANIRYLGLQSMCRLALKHDLSKHQNKILANLDDADISIRRRALDLLYLICNSENVSQIVAQLLGYLQNRNDPLIKDDLVLKIAILAQKFTKDLRQYVNAVIKLMRNAQVENDIWYRILQIITGFVNHNIQLETYAAQKLYIALNQPFVTDTLKCVGCYVISQFSQRIVRSEKDPQKIFDIINKHFQSGGNKSKSMMLSSFVKLASKYPQLKQQVQMICHLSSGHWDPDVQQRGVEYLVLMESNPEILKKVLEINPAFTEEQQLSNPLVKKFLKISKKLKEIPSSSDTQQTVKSTVKSFDEITPRQVNQISHPLSNHPCFKSALDKLCKNNINLLDLPSKLQVKPYWKEVFVKKTPVDDVQYKQQLEDGVLKVKLIVNIQTNQMQFKLFKSKGFNVTNLPVTYSPTTQQIKLIFKLNGQKIQPPIIGIAWNTESDPSKKNIKRKQIELPITIANFFNPVQLKLEKFKQFYNDYSLPNDKFYKLDAFLKIPDNVKSGDFLKKIGSFLSSLCHFKCNAFPSFDNVQQIYGAATFVLKQQQKMLNIPILIESQAYTVERVSAARVSIRGGNGPAIESLFQLVLTFLN